MTPVRPHELAPLAHWRHECRHYILFGIPHYFVKVHNAASTSIWIDWVNLLNSIIAPLQMLVTFHQQGWRGHIPCWVTRYAKHIMSSQMSKRVCDNLKWLPEYYDYELFELHGY